MYRSVAGGLNRPLNASLSINFLVDEVLSATKWSTHIHSLTLTPPLQLLHTALKPSKSIYSSSPSLLFYLSHFYSLNINSTVRKCLSKDIMFNWPLSFLIWIVTLGLSVTFFKVLFLLCPPFKAGRVLTCPIFTSMRRQKLTALCLGYGRLDVTKILALLTSKEILIDWVYYFHGASCILHNVIGIKQ